MVASVSLLPWYQASNWIRLLEITLRNRLLQERVQTSVDRANGHNCSRKLTDIFRNLWVVEFYEISEVLDKQLMLAVIHCLDYLL